MEMHAQATQRLVRVKDSLLGYVEAGRGLLLARDSGARPVHVMLGTTEFQMNFERRASPRLPINRRRNTADSRDCCGSSLRCRSYCCRQCDSKRIAAQHHHQYQPPNRPLNVTVGAKKLGDVADGCILTFDLPDLGARGKALGFEVRKGLTLKLAPCRKCLAGFA